MKGKSIDQGIHGIQEVVGSIPRIGQAFSFTIIYQGLTFRYHCCLPATLRSKYAVCFFALLILVFDCFVK
jgi:hypothetical protein